jgi:hypothetical protein
MMALEHGRTRYTRGCRCDVRKGAEREYRRSRYRRRRGLPVDPPAPPKLSVVDSPPVSSYDGSVVAAARVELDAAAGAAERPGLTAVALALAAILDDSKHVPTQPAAARQLAAILETLSKRSPRRRSSRWSSRRGRVPPQPMVPAAFADPGRIQQSRDFRGTGPDQKGPALRQKGLIRGREPIPRADQSNRGRG